MAKKGRKSNPVPSDSITVTLPVDTIAFLDAIAKIGGGGYGRSRNEAAALLIRDEMMRLIKARELDGLEQAMRKVRELAATIAPEDSPTKSPK